MTARIFLKLILGVLCVLVVALTAVDFQASKVAKRTYVDILTRNLAGKCQRTTPNPRAVRGLEVGPARVLVADVGSNRAEEGFGDFLMGRNTPGSFAVGSPSQVL